MSDVGRIRALHDVGQHFEMSEDVAEALTSQLKEDDRASLERFRSGFQVEGWFEAIFSVMPWANLIHGLSQQQFPSHSKKEYQVPDYLALIETTSRTQKPFLVEVKRARGNKSTLRVQRSQFELTEQYAQHVGLSLLYATYWDKFNAWTINAPVSFENNSSCRKLNVLRALETDCSLIFGDITFLLLKPITRTQVFDKRAIDDTAVLHEKYGTLIADTVRLDENDFSLSSIETAALDSIYSIREKDAVVTQDGDRTTLQLMFNETHAVRLSNWITRHLAIYRILPDEERAHLSANVIDVLTKRLGIQHCNIFPWGLETLADLEDACFQSSLDAAKIPK
jgi:hypothetical protein